MRHKNKTKYLGRTASHRDAMLSNMAASLITHKRIFTTVPKPIITRSKEDTTNSRRIVFSMLQNKYAVAELFQSVSPKVSDRPGGYTRIIKTGYRLGDNAAMCFIELVDFNENMLSEDKTKKTRTRRSRRRSGGAETAAQVAAETTGTKKASEEAKSEEVKQAEKAVVKESEAPAQVEAEAVPSNEQPVTAEAPAEEAPVEEAPAAADEAAAEEPKENEKEVDDAKES